MEEAYANLPLVKKPDVAKRQMLPDHQELRGSLTMEEAQRQQQSLTMEEAMKLQSMNLDTKQQSMTMEEAQQRQKLRPIQQHMDNNLTNESSQKEKSKQIKSSPPLHHSDAFENNGNVPSWRNEKILKSLPPPSNNSLESREATIRYSPTWSTDKSKDGRQSDRTPSPKFIQHHPHHQSSQIEKDKKIYVSSVSIPQQTAPCFVVNNPCMFTGSYPCYVMNVPQSTSYVPVQIYPMMLVPNSSSPNRLNSRMVY